MKPPKEKIVELLLLMKQATSGKECALVAVNEALRVAFHSNNDELYNYYHEVRQELEKDI